MTYHIVEESEFFFIKISGKPKKNEVVLAKNVLSSYLKKKGMKVIIDLKELEDFEPITLLLVLASIRKEIGLSRGCLRLCSLKPEIRNYFRENHLDQIFAIYEDEEMAKKSEWRNYGNK